MGNKIIVSRKDFFELLEDVVDTDVEDGYRHGYFKTWILQKDDKFWSVTLPVTPDGIELYGDDVELTEVIRKEKVVYEWVDA